MLAIPKRREVMVIHMVLELLGVAGLALCMLIGCGPASSTIPPGGQAVHVTVAGSDVRLDPPTAHAGDIYVVLDTPGSSVGFAQRRSTEAETPGPLTDGDIDRLSHGDTQGTAIGGFDDTTCSDEQRVSQRGRMGHCGNVFKVVLSPGRYAFFTSSLERAAPGDTTPITILEILP